jgi:hypothetical protein
MSKSFDEIISLMRQRRTADAFLIQAMVENRDRYNGGVVVPMPDVSSIPVANRPGPNFFQEAVDGHARLANSVQAKIECPVKNPGSNRSEELASLRQGFLYGNWYESQLELKLGRAYRHLAAYGTQAMIVLPDEVLGRPDIQIRDPLTAYPELRAPDDIRPPLDCGFLFARSAQWLTEHYPDKVPHFLSGIVDKGWDTLWDVVEWIDEDDIVIGVMGPRFPAYSYADARPYGYNALELGRWPNKAGMVPVVAPRRATLDMIMGQLTAMINYSDLYGRMLSLELVATEKAIFPDLAILSRTGDVPILVGGTWKDGRTGDVNLITNAAVEVIGKEPGPGTIPVLQMIDNHIRGGTGANAMMSGGNSGMRTGAGVDALGDFAINPMVAESQAIMARTLVEVNKAVIAVAKGYFGSKTFTMPLGMSGSSKTVSVKPDRDLDSDVNVVYYEAPGADVNRFAVALTQLNATGIISRHTARQKHPMVDDADEEEQFVALEKLSDATMAAAANEIAQGSPTMSTAVVARTAELVASGLPMYKAFLQSQAEAASQAPAPGTPGGPTPSGPDGQPLSPSMAQMLAAQGAGPDAPPGGPIAAANPSLMNLRHVLQGVNESISPQAV